jgi:hypothetical protein
VLFVANIAAIVVALVFSWRLNDLVTLYWLELIAVGFITLLQMRAAIGAGTFAKSPGYLIVLFVAHYGTFCVLYRTATDVIFDRAESAPWFWAAIWPALAIIISAHIVSLRRDYLDDEAVATSRFDAMWIPYFRELPVFIPLLIALALVDGGSVARSETVLFGLGKTTIDAIAHVVYHTRIAKRR